MMPIFIFFISYSLDKGMFFIVADVSFVNYCFCNQ